METPKEQKLAQYRIHGDYRKVDCTEQLTDLNHITKVD